MLSDRHRGSVVFLFPAAIVILLVLAALTVDAGYVRLRGRELEAAAASAANDALAALDIRELRSTGTLTIDPVVARRIAADTTRHGPIPDATVLAVAIETDPTGNATEITVTLQTTLDLVFAPAVGDLDTVTLTRTGRAVIVG